MRAEQLAELASQGLLPARIAEADEFEAAVQVVRGHQVISSTSKAAAPDFFGLPPEPAGSDRVIHVDHLPIDDDGPFRVTALGTPTPQGPATIYVAVDVEDVGEFLGTLARKGAVGLTVLLGVFACTLWLVVGRTIGSVEAIRRRAELITGRRLNQRVPEPTTHDEIFRLARTLNDMLGRLEESAKRQERFVADAAHELRTPLTTLRTQLETAMMRSDPDPDPRLLPELWSEAVRMGSLVDQLLLLARSDAGTLPFLDHPVDLDDVLRDVLTSTPTGGSPSGRDDVEPVQVRGNAALLEQVVRNLVENAVRPRGGRGGPVAELGRLDRGRHGGRRRAGHRAGGPRGGVPPVRAARRLPGPLARGSGSGPCHRGGDRPDPLRFGRGDRVARRRCEVHRPPPRRTPTGRGRHVASTSWPPPADPARVAAKAR